MKNPELTILHGYNDFGWIKEDKKGWPGKPRIKKLARILQATRHEEFLVSNLDLQDYIDAVYDGSLDNVPSYFAKYCSEAFEIRKLRKTNEQKEVLSISKKIFAPT